jgi:hypothetical protein
MRKICWYDQAVWIYRDEVVVADQSAAGKILIHRFTGGATPTDRGPRHLQSEKGRHERIA